MMKILTIKWQRLVERGQTCPRCEATGDEVNRAVATLRERLKPCGVTVTLETAELDRSTWQADPGQSNRIWIGGRPLEDWLEGRVGHSTCCGVCGEEECRTLEVEGQTYEAVPAALIVQAGIMAAGQLLSPAGTCGCSGPVSCPPGA
jgi:anti-sigma factor RsiW